MLNGMLSSPDNIFENAIFKNHTKLSTSDCVATLVAQRHQTVIAGFTTRLTNYSIPASVDT
uniref:Uncharacterized protein n=1 Tax=Timema cristinae TaxID=61476 RepID=A0A7R9CXR5_TIMCR|nr:unnamed protein product [Timema cristinae]